MGCVFAVVLCTALPAQAGRVFDRVVLDPGHGGWDRGGLPRIKIKEKEVALDTALKVRDFLEEAGLRVVMTRETDVYIPLSTRCEIANQHGDAIFVSVHYNATYGASAYGIETYSSRGSSKSQPLRNLIHRQMVRQSGSRDRGVRTAGFYVLRHTRQVAVLVECGFMSNPREAKKIADSDYRTKLARAIADGILDYRDSLSGSALPRRKKPPEPPPAPKPESTDATPAPATASRPSDDEKLPEEQTPRPKPSLQSEKAGSLNPNR